MEAAVRAASIVKGLRSARTLLAFCLFLIFGGAAFSQTSQQSAWQIVKPGLAEHNTSRRAAAVAALGLLQGDSRAVEFAEEALGDKKASVRASAAIALGQMGSISSIPLLRKALADNDNLVFFAAADSLISLKDSAGYDLYYDVLTGERKSGEGLIASKKRLIADPRLLVLLGLGVGIEQAPYAGYGWMVWKELSKDYVSPVRVAALRQLANDQDQAISKGLIEAACDKHWRVRVAALFAIGRHGDPALIDQITPHMTDRTAAVRYVAATAVLRLSALAPVVDTSQEAANSSLSTGGGHRW